MTICIVDDTQSQRLILATILRAAGYTDLLLAESAPAAFEIMGLGDSERRPARVDLILMDIEMPVMDGIEACRRLKQYPSTTDTPVIIVTGSVDNDDIQLAFAAGAVD